jgi:NAD(P)-dependent dehydrogenase (short-subunit alcohol dehydrogenase family)
MPAEHVKHIFESFYQIDVHHAGSGIGLALVKAFVEMHGGTIAVDSGEGRGTVFTLEMPVQQNGVPEENVEKNIVLTNLKEGAVLSADQETIQTAPEVVERDDKETVLIIDDNQDVRDYVKSLLLIAFTEK